MNPNLGLIGGRSSGRCATTEEQPISGSAQTWRFPHSFGRPPMWVRGVLVLKLADANRKQGAEYDLSYAGDASNGVAAFNVYADAAEIVIIYSGAANIRLLEDDGGNSNITIADWMVKAYAAF